MYLKLRILQFWKFLDVRGRRLNNKRKETRPHIGQSRRRIESNRIDERGRVVLAAAASLLRPASVERRSVSRERARFRAKGWLSSLVNEEATKPPKLSASFPPFSLSLSFFLFTKANGMTCRVTGRTYTETDDAVLRGGWILFLATTTTDVSVPRLFSFAPVIRTFEHSLVSSRNEMFAIWEAEICLNETW